MGGTVGWNLIGVFSPPVTLCGSVSFAPVEPFEFVRVFIYETYRGSWPFGVAIF